MKYYQLNPAALLCLCLLPFLLPPATAKETIFLSKPEATLLCWPPWWLGSLAETRPSLSRSCNNQQTVAPRFFVCAFFCAFSFLFRWGELGIMREEQDDHGSRDEGSRKRRLGAFLFLRLALRAKCRVYHVYHALIWLIKRLFPVMQAKVVVTGVFFFGERGKDASFYLRLSNKRGGRTAT